MATIITTITAMITTMTIRTVTATTITIIAGTIAMDDAHHAQAQELKQQLADALRMLERAEVIDFNGHMSCRLPGTQHILINSGKSVRSALGAADIIAIDMQGKPVEGDVVPPMEFHIHTEIYRRRPDVGAVIHTHQYHAALLAAIGETADLYNNRSIMFFEDQALYGDELTLPRALAVLESMLFAALFPKEAQEAKPGKRTKPQKARRFRAKAPKGDG